MYDYRKWKHVFKINPSKEIDDDTLESICESGTDAVMIGGIDGATIDNVLQMLVRVRRYMVPCVLEVTNVEMMVPGFDVYFLPMIVNSKDTGWLTGFQYQIMKEVGDITNWDEVVPMGYCVLDVSSMVGKITSVTDSVNVDGVIAYARLVEKFYRFPIFYVDDRNDSMEVVKAVKNTLQHTHIF